MLVEIFCKIDDFCKVLDKEMGIKLLGCNLGDNKKAVKKR